VEIIFDFSCLVGSSCSGGPSGTPPDLILNYVEDDSSTFYPVTNAYTNSGPNAVEISGLKGSSSLVLMTVLAATAGGSLLLRKDSSKKPAYITPAIVADGELGVRAGSPLEDPEDGLDPSML
ncbi:MAG: hypothetical protein P1S60_17125, partial [Anaerolineae bacterium]|nr:hypothetical protein [Anaerolineae bacterium]